MYKKNIVAILGISIATWSIADVERRRVTKYGDSEYMTACYLSDSGAMSYPTCASLQQANESPAEALKRIAYTKVRDRQERRCKRGGVSRSQLAVPGKIIGENASQRCRTSGSLLVCDLDYEAQCEMIIYEGSQND